MTYYFRLTDAVSFKGDDDLWTMFPVGTIVAGTAIDDMTFMLKLEGKFWVADDPTHTRDRMLRSWLAPLSPLEILARAAK